MHRTVVTHYCKEGMTFLFDLKVTTEYIWHNYVQLNCCRIIYYTFLSLVAYAATRLTQRMQKSKF